jgi:hypothetical protein
MRILCLFDFSLYLCSKNHLIVMGYDILQSVSQGSDGAQDAENSRIATIADELERLCAVYEAQCRDGQKDVTHFDAEQRAAEQMAKEHGFWLPCLEKF